MTKKSKEGQALFEFIMFLPFLLYLFSVMLTLGNALNSSINQQKATRSYTFHLYKGNANVPTMQDLIRAKKEQKTFLDLIAIGWRVKSGEGTDSFASCFKFQDFLSPFNFTGTCDRPAIEDKMSPFIRIYTAFGWCGTSYTKAGKNDFFIRDARKRVGPQRRPCRIE